MIPHIPEYIRTLAPYVPGKPIEETQREYKLKRVVKLASNENPLGPSPKAIAAMKKGVSELHRYPDASAYALKQAISKYLSVDSDSLLIGNGSNEIIELLIRTYCVPGDAIVTSKAAFIAYRISAQIHGVETLEAQLTPDLRFDLNEMADLVKKYDRAKMVFIANPNNPTGTYVTETELRDFLKKIQKIRGGSVIVALDYAYWEYVTAKDLPDPMKLMHEFSNVVVMRTFSKIHGLAGLRLGYGVGTPEMIAAMQKIRQPFNNNSLALIAGEAALSDKVFVKKARDLNIREMKVWEKALSKMGIPFWKSQGNFILADVGTGLGKRGGDVYLSCLKRGVIFRPVTNYGLQDALRISIGTAKENEIAIKALALEVPHRQTTKKKGEK